MQNTATQCRMDVMQAGETSLGIPAVSVIVANLNGAAYLSYSIAFPCRQSLNNIEIIVSDDASTDDSVNIVTRMMNDDHRIRILTCEHNAGPSAARNKALAIAKGEWIAVMDSDDLMHPARLETLVAAAVCDGADMVADDLLIFDSIHFEVPKALLKGKWARAPFWVDLAGYV